MDHSILFSAIRLIRWTLEPGSDFPFFHFFVFKMCNARNTEEPSRLSSLHRGQTKEEVYVTATAVKNREIRCQLQPLLQFPLNCTNCIFLARCEEMRAVNISRYYPHCKMIPYLSNSYTNFFFRDPLYLLKSWNWKILIKKRNVILILYKFVILFNLIIIQNGDIVEESFHYFNRIRFISIIISQNCKCKNIRMHLFCTFL